MSVYINVSKLDDGFMSNQGSYQRKIQFSRSELKQIYSNCGRWAQLEEKVYGNVLSSDAHYKEYVEEHRSLSLISKQLKRVFY